MPRKKKAKRPGDRHAQASRLLRATDEQFERWQREAKRAGVKLSEWMRAALDAAAK